MKTNAMILSLSLSLTFTVTACGEGVGYDEGSGDGGVVEDTDGEDGQDSIGEGDGGAGGGGGEGGSADGGGDGDGGRWGGDGGGEDTGGEDGSDDESGDDDADGGDADGGDADGTGGSGLECDLVDVDLVAGQYYEAGLVTVSTTDEGLLVEIDAAAPWVLNMVHIYAGTEVPGPNPGAYPFAESLDHAEAYQRVIPFDLLDGQCGDVLLVAVHAEVSKPLGDGTCHQETAWGEGEREFDVGWGSAFEVTLCCD